MSKQTIEIAYSFFHQKLQVYQYSTLEWQRDDIEYAIADYVGMMDKDLYQILAKNNPQFMLNHGCFEQDLKQAVSELDEMLLLC